MSDATKDAREARLARIRALMAKTVDAGCTEAEAKLAAEAVDRLLALYEIDLDEVSVKTQPIVRIEVAMVSDAISYAASAIASFTDCKTWLAAHGTRLVYFGFKVDAEISEYLTLVFQRAIAREALNFTMFNPDHDALNARGQHAMVSSFKIGMAARLGERLGELKSKRDFTQKSTGRDLVAIKSPLVEEAFAALGPHLSRGRGRGTRISDPAAYGAGRTAAEGVAINQGIAGRAARSGGRLR